MELVSRGKPDISMSGIALREMIPGTCMRNLNKKGNRSDRMNFTLKEIAEACRGKLVLQGASGDENCSVSSVVIDSRLVEPGGVFIATQGERVDGHIFISYAFAKGAVLAVTQKSPEQVKAEHGPLPGWGSYLLVEDTLQALKDMAEAYRKKLAVKIVGITGSVGKTSTKEFIAGVLAEKYQVLKTEGNFNNEIGVPLTLLRIRPEHEVAVVEMGISDFGEMHRLSKMARPDICVMTNIGQSHLNNLKDRDGILRAKSEIFDFMAENGEICLNGEDDKLAGLKEIKGHIPHFFGLGNHPGEEASVTDIIGNGLEGSDAVLLMKRREGEPVRQPVHIPLPGRHMALNAAAAACVAGLLDLSAGEIAAGIEKVGLMAGRTNVLRLPRYTLIDDCYNANPASVKAAIDLLAQADTIKVAILGDMLNLGENSHRYHQEAGSHAAALGIEHILCVGEESRHMFWAAANNAEETTKISHYPDTETLLRSLASDCGELVPEGSTVLIKASHDMGFAKVLEFLRS